MKELGKEEDKRVGKGKRQKERPSRVDIEGWNLSLNWVMKRRNAETKLPSPNAVPVILLPTISCFPPDFDPNMKRKFKKQHHRTSLSFVFEELTMYLIGKKTLSTNKTSDLNPEDVLIFSVLILV